MKQAHTPERDPTNLPLLGQFYAPPHGGSPQHGKGVCDHKHVEGIGDQQSIGVRDNTPQLAAPVDSTETENGAGWRR
eukprot:11740478-Prorocentrum_lima.AAC.1